MAHTDTSNKANYIKEMASFILNGLQKSKWNILLGFILSILAIGSLIIIHYISGVDYWIFMKDPVVVLIHPDFDLENPLFVGYFSQMGGMVWALSGGVCLAGILIAQNQNLPLKNMLLHAFIFTLFLGIDDVFMLHDEIFPLYGVHENVFLVAYLLISSSFLLFYFKTILKTQFPVFGLALFCLASSVFLDKIPASFKEIVFRGFFTSIIFEDGFKMAGILFWLIYFASVTKMAFDQSFLAAKRLERLRLTNLNGQQSDSHGNGIKVAAFQAPTLTK